MKEKRRFAVLLAAMAVAAFLTAVPAMATQGGGDVTETSSASQELPQDQETPPPGTPITTPEPVTPPPSSSSESSSSSSSSSSDPWGGSSQGPGSSSSSSEDPWESSSSSSENPGSGLEDPSSSSEEPGWDDPSSSSSVEDPWESSGSESESPTQGGTTSSNTATLPPDYEPEAIATPRPAVERPSISLNTGSSSSSGEEESSGPNYVTFATLNVRGNSMAATLFYGGVGCIALGVLGLITILALYLHGRRRYAGPEGILEEIHEAEARQHQPSQQPTAPAHVPPPGAIVPEQASLYTGEFTVPPQEASYGQEAYPAYEDYEDYGDGDYREEDYGESYGQYTDDMYYDNSDYYDDGYEEDYGPEEDVSPAQSQLPYEQPAPQPAQPPQDQQATRQFDTEEILREALRYTDEDYWDDSSQQ